MEPIVRDDRARAREAQKERIIKRESGKPGYKGRVTAFCCHCIFDTYQTGTWLQQVEACTSLDCPLYSVRPLPSTKGKVCDG